MAKPSSRSRSRYAEKKASGKQLYGPGCCANSLPAAAIQAAKDRAYRAGQGHRRFAPPPEVVTDFPPTDPGRVEPGDPIPSSLLSFVPGGTRQRRW